MEDSLYFCVRRLSRTAACIVLVCLVFAAAAEAQPLNMPAVRIC